jgi:putrescine aminotransferase
MHTTTTGGNPLACAAALAAIEVMLEEDTPRQAAEKGDYMMAKLNELKARYPDVLKEVSGQGLLIGMRFPSSTVGYKVASGLFQRRVLTAGTLISAESIRIEPALNVPMNLLDEVLNRLEDTLKNVKLEPGDIPPAAKVHSFSKPECYGPCAWGTKCLAK